MADISGSWWSKQVDTLVVVEEKVFRAALLWIVWEIVMKELPTLVRSVAENLLALHGALS
jgi:hypothetical protein